MQKIDETPIIVKKKCQPLGVPCQQKKREKGCRSRTEHKIKDLAIDCH